MSLDFFPKEIYNFIFLVSATIAAVFGANNQPVSQTNQQLVYPTIAQAETVLESQNIAVYGPEVPASLAKEAAEGEILAIATFSAEPTSTPKPSDIKILATIKPTFTPTQTPTVKPTSKPTHHPTPAPTPKATLKPTPVPTLAPDSIGADITTKTNLPPELVIPTPKPVVEQKSLSSDLIFQLINNERLAQNLPLLETDQKLCELAKYRAPMLYDEIFVTGNLHQGLYDMNLPYWITENMAYYPTEQLIVKWWMGSFIHRKAILGNFKYSCGACVGTACTQLFTSYIPK